MYKIAIIVVIIDIKKILLRVLAYLALAVIKNTVKLEVAALLSVVVALSVIYTRIEG
jgi:hypothetical protein